MAAALSVILLSGLTTGANFGVAQADSPPVAQVTGLPNGFSDTAVWNVPAVTDIAGLPDGRILLTSQPGQLRVVTAAGALVAAPALDLAPRICATLERGLLAATPHPGFATNRWIYVSWTRKVGADCSGTTGTPTNRVSRFTLGADHKVVAGSEVVVLDHLVSPSGYHNGGDLAFGADGLLYVTAGDGACQLSDPARCGGLNGNARRLDVPLGKLLRVRPDGTAPATNPFAGAPGARRCTRPAGPDPGTGPCAEVYSFGLRNPFRMAVRPGTNTFWLNDVGQTSWEEVDQAAPGADFGWNICEGTHRTGTDLPCPATGTTPPVLEYPHDANGCTSITGGAFVPAGTWPTGWAGDYLFADYVCGRIFARDESGAVSTFAQGLDAPVALAFASRPGGGQALYYSALATGTVHRIVPSSTNTAPTARLSAATRDDDPMVVEFDGSASSDPNGGDRVVTWRWQFGDGSTQVTTEPRVSHRYTGTAPATASLAVVDSRGAWSVRVTRRVVPGNRLPTITLTGTEPTFGVGELVPMSATAVDPETGSLPGTAITWVVKTRHDEHVHNRLGPVTGRTAQTRFPAPEDVPAALTMWLEVTVSATDPAGWTRTVTQRVLPALVDVSFVSTPSGGEVLVNGYPKTTPATVTSWRGWPLILEGLDQDLGGVPHACIGWTDGAPCSRQVVTPAEPTGYEVTFAPR